VLCESMIAGVNNPMKVGGWRAPPSGHPYKAKSGTVIDKVPEKFTIGSQFLLACSLQSELCPVVFW
jgi:hypothetical protein